MQKVIPFLWFDGKAREAAEFYTEVFKAPPPRGKGGGVTFEVAGLKIHAFDGGPMFTFNETISLYVDCADQTEVDYYWQRLTEGGEESQCGWLKDRFGVSWQIVPRALPRLLGDPDPDRSQRAMQAMLKMRKLDVAALEAAADGDAGA